MKGAEFYEGGRIQVYIGLRERGEGGEKEGPGKFGLSLEEKETGSEKRRSEIWKGTKRKRGPTRLNRPTLEKLAATCQPLLDLMYLIFHRFSILEPSPPGSERNASTKGKSQRGKEELQFCFFDRIRRSRRRWKFFTLIEAKTWTAEEHF